MIITMEYIEELKNDLVYPPSEEEIEELMSCIGEELPDSCLTDHEYELTEQDIYEQGRKKNQHT